MSRSTMDGRRHVAFGVLSLLALLSCAEPGTGPGRPAEREAVGWQPVVLARSDALRPGPPPAEGSPTAQEELDEVVRVQAARTPVTDSLVRHYDGDPTAVWTRAAVDLLGLYWSVLPDLRIATPARSARVMALLHVAMYDAVLATWDAKYAYSRRAPARASERVRAVVPVGAVPSYPSEHAAVAAAAYEILAASFLPGDTARLRTMLREAGESRIAAGAAFRGDVDAGYSLGRAVAQRVLARAATDGADRAWTGSVPAGEYFWKPTPVRHVRVPFDALAGTWRTWVIPSGDAYRPPPHPLPGTSQFTAALEELHTLAGGARTEAQVTAARYWATEAPTARWDLYVDDELTKRRLSVPRSARARMYTSIAMYDAFVACWEAKYHYWLARPVTMSPDLEPLYSTPPFPSYPSGHSTISTAAAAVMAELFPDAAHRYHERAVEASESRVWGGVHYRFDIEAGDTLGVKVGRDVVARMRGDGAR